MKNLPYITLFLFVHACKPSEEVVPNSEISIEYGTYNYQVLLYPVQDSIPSVHLEKVIAVAVKERNLPDQIVGPYEENIDELPMQMQMSTTEDEETFIKGENVFCSGYGIGSELVDHEWYSEVSFNFIIPIKVGKAQPGNDPLEVKENDFIKTTYESLLTKDYKSQMIKILN